MISLKTHHLIASEDSSFSYNFLTSKMITCFKDGFASRLKAQSIAYLLNDSEHIHIGCWALKAQSIAYLLNDSEHIHIGCWALKLTYTQYEYFEQDDLQEWSTKVFYEIGQGGQQLEGRGQRPLSCLGSLTPKIPP